MKVGKSEKTKWKKTSVPNLFRNQESKRYYFRASVSRDGKRREVWKSLKTSVLSVAKLRLADEQTKIEHRRQVGTVFDSDRPTVGALGSSHEQQVKETADLSQAGKDSRLYALQRLWNTWPGLSSLAPADVSRKDCERWLNAFKQDAGGLGPKKGQPPSASSVNTTINSLRRVFELAVENGFIYHNPAAGLKYKPAPNKHLHLPSGKQFRALLEEVGKNPYSKGAVDTVAVLGFSGIRLGEGMALRWSDVDFDRGLLSVPGTKSRTSFRTIPLFPPLRAHLEKMKALWDPKPADAVLTVRDCQKAIDTATEALELPRMTHHDLRHFFISSCIEAGIDFLTISRWVGHADGGALLAKKYGHLRPEYSMEAAKRVTFGEDTPENVVEIKEGTHDSK